MAKSAKIPKGPRVAKRTLENFFKQIVNVGLYYLTQHAASSGYQPLMWITFHVPATWVPLGVDAISDLGSGKDGCDCVFPPLRLTALRHLNRLAVQQGDTLTLQSILHVTCARISLVSIQAQCHPCACYGNGTTLTLSI